MKTTTLNIKIFTEPQGRNISRFIIMKEDELYRTLIHQEDFTKFLLMANLRLRYVNILENLRRGNVIQYEATGIIEEVEVDSVLDIPDGAVKCSLLIEGKIVPHYYIHTQEGSIIYTFSNKLERESYVIQSAHRLATPNKSLAVTLPL